MTTNKTALGKQGETAAIIFLKKQGYRIIEKNFRLPSGEIDIIAQDGHFLVFVEVKLRRGGDYGSPEEAINKRKIAKIEKLGTYYAYTHPHLPQALRIDVVSIGPKKKNGQWQIELFRNIHTSL